MTIKNNQSFRKIQFRVFNSVLLIYILTLQTWGQITSVPVPKPVAPAEDFTWWYVTLFILALGLAGTIFWWLNGKKAQKNSTSKSNQVTNGRNNAEMNSLDGDKELEWLRKNQQLVGKKKQKPVAKKKSPSNLPQTVNAAGQNAAAAQEKSSMADDVVDNSAAALPIFSIERLEWAKPFDALPLSNDEDLMGAVEQTYEEMEEDEEVRDLAVRILAAFKTRNSVEALSQFALYDLSSNLRSKAVSILSEFDHESVFETILLACADPTREVRAAAARGLTKLTFDRADAWTRIAESDEEGRVVHAARAAMESGFVDMSFDRLVHQDGKQAYEAFALMALLIKAGETEKIFNALETHKNINVRKAVLHIIKVTKDQKALDGLYLLLEKNNLPIEFQEEVDKTIEEIGFVTA